MINRCARTEPGQQQQNLDLSTCFGRSAKPKKESTVGGMKEALHPVKPLITGVKAVDRTSLLVIQWYTRQIHRMGKGKNPVPNESALKALFFYILNSSWGLFKARKLRA